MEPKVSEEYSKLYHYTTLEGLLGILQTNTLWATQYQFLNDYSELVLIRDKLIESYFHIAKEECRKLSRQRKDFQKISDRWGGLNKFAIHYAETMVNAAYKATGENIYIVSFCREDKNDYVNSNGLLSQWRGYGVGGGFTLVFDTKKMEEILNIEAERYTYDFGQISDVIYSDDEDKFEKELSSYQAEIFDFFNKCLNNYLKGQGAPDTPITYQEFVGCISRYKHLGFKEENEARIVCIPTTKKEYIILAEKERKLRPKNGKLIPYIELFNSNDIILPIKKIIVGPHKEKDSRASALRVSLRNTITEITVSDIPYVD